MDSRRDFIKKAALLSGAFGLPNVIPMSIQKAMAINAAPGSTFYDAEHVVFLMQENRSFDHMFGKLKGVRGFNDPRTHTLPNKNKVWLQDDDQGHTFAPFHIDLNKTKVTWQGGLPHSWNDQTAARNKGKYDKWVPVKSLMSMAHYQREDIPFYYALADAFTVCDQSFCASLTGTTPNRLFFWTGSNRPLPTGENAAVVNNSQAESQDNVFVDWETFPEVLEDNGIDWRVYQNEIWTAKLPSETDDWLGNYGDNPLEYIKRHNVKLASYFRENGDHMVNPPLSAEQVQEKYNSLSQREKNLIDKAFTTNSKLKDYLKLEAFRYTDEKGKKQTLNIPAEDIFHQFREDVNNGKLPMISWLVAPQRFSDHTSSPLYGTWYVSEALDILTKNPEVWKKTIFILTYDENDGYFDHVPPFVAPKPNAHSSGKVSAAIDSSADYEKTAESPIGLGYRVPMVIVSPWSKGGFVNSQVFDHTSSLMFLENFLTNKTGKAIRSKQISSWRRAVCGDLTSVFRPYNGDDVLQSPKPLKKTDVISHIQSVKDKPEQHTPKPLNTEEIAKINTHHPFQKSSSALMPKQEPGVKPACALPYEFFVDAELNEAKTSILLNFEVEKNSAGAAFNVNALQTYGNDKGRTWAYAVSSGDKLTDNWELENFEDAKYDLSVQGANGFFRRFKGDKNDPALSLVCVYGAYGKSRMDYRMAGELIFIMKNFGDEDLEILIKDESYKELPAISRLVKSGISKWSFNIRKNKGWYDFTVKVKGKEGFSKRYAGHVENGLESSTDPLMGGTI